MSRAAIIDRMSHLQVPGSRTLTVVLSESEWRAFRDVEPDAVGWLQERIRERLGAPESASHPVSSENHAPVASGAASWDDDEY